MKTFYKILVFISLTLLLSIIFYDRGYQEGTVKGMEYFPFYGSYYAYNIALKHHWEAIQRKNALDILNSDFCKGARKCVIESGKVPGLDSYLLEVEIKKDDPT